MVLSSILGAFIAFVGIRVTKNDQETYIEAIHNVGSWVAGQLGQEWETGTPHNFTPKDVGDLKNEFLFNGTGTFDVYRALANITNLERKMQCEESEEMTKQNLYGLIDAIGNESNLSSTMVKKMKLSINGGRGFKATEHYVFGRNGFYVLLKYLANQTKSGNYNFLVAFHSFAWVLDGATAEERERLFEERLGNVKDVLVKDLHKSGETDILNWFLIQNNPSRTFSETDIELKNLRTNSEETLAHSCKVLAAGQ